MSTLLHLFIISFFIKRVWIEFPIFRFAELRANVQNCTGLCEIARNCSGIVRNCAEFRRVYIACVVNLRLWLSVDLIVPKSRAKSFPLNIDYMCLNKDNKIMYLQL